MKKFYAFAAVAMMAFAANAQDDAPTFTPGDALYITGDSDEFGDAKWNATAPAEFVYADGVYTFEIGELTQFKISSVAGGWDSFNTGALSVQGGDITREMLGVATPLVPWGDNTFCPWKGEYKIVVAGDLSTITVTTTTPDPGAQAAEVFLRGDFVAGWAADPAWQFTQYKGDVYKLVLADDQVIKVGEAFKVADANWAKINWCTKDMGMFEELEYEMFYNTSENMGFAEDFTGVIWVNINSESAKFEASSDKEYVPEWADGGGAVSEIEANDNAVATYYNLQGVRVANPENGLFIVVKGNKTSKVLVK